MSARAATATPSAPPAPRRRAWPQTLAIGVLVVVVMVLLVLVFLQKNATSQYAASHAGEGADLPAAAQSDVAPDLNAATDALEPPATDSHATAAAAVTDAGEAPYPSRGSRTALTAEQALALRQKLLDHPAVTPGDGFDKPGVQATGGAILDAIASAHKARNPQ